MTTAGTIASSRYMTNIQLWLFALAAILLLMEMATTGSKQDIPREPILHVPEDCSTQVDIMLHETHAGISWPALLVVVPHNVLVVGVRVLSEVSLDEVFGLLSSEAEHDVHLQMHACPDENLVLT